jgi:hypothetical protein
VDVKKVSFYFLGTSFKQVVVNWQNFFLKPFTHGKDELTKNFDKLSVELEFDLQEEPIRQDLVPGFL